MNNAPSDATASRNILSRFLPTSPLRRVAGLSIILIVTASVSITVISLAQSKRRKAAVTRTAAKTQQRGSARGMSRAGGRGEAESRGTGPVKPQEPQGLPDRGQTG